MKDYYYYINQEEYMKYHKKYLNLDTIFTISSQDIFTDIVFDIPKKKETTIFELMDLD